MIGLGLEETLLQYLRAVGWSVTAAVGFAFGVGIALKVFDYLSTDIDAVSYTHLTLPTKRIV